MNFNDWIGSIGVGLLLFAFILSLSNKIPKSGMTYFVINFVGSGLAAAASYLIHYIPFVVLEFAWMLTSAYGIWQSYKKTKSAS